MGLRACIARLFALTVIATLAPATLAQRVCLLQIDTQYGPCLDAPNPVAACTDALNTEPRDFRARAALCEAHARNGDYTRALAALEAGKDVHRGDGFLLGIIDRAISNVREKSEASVKRPPDLQTLIDYMVLRCVKLKNAEACDEALAADPGNREALAGKAALMMDADDPVAAIQAYRQALAAQDDPDMRAALTQAEGRRRERVSACLNASRPAAVPGCKAVLIAGEDDEYDLYAKIGDLEASRGALSRALTAYGKARQARSTGTIRTRIAAVTSARRCLSSSSADACVDAFGSLPNGAMFAGVRANVSLTGCRALLGAGGPDAIERATPLCEDARRRVATQDVEDEIDTLLAAAVAGPDEPSVPVVAPRPPPSTPPPVARASECLALARRDSVSDAAIRTCERELADAAGRADEAKLAAALAELERRRDAALFRDLSARCLEGEGGLRSCERALELAPPDGEIAALQQKVEALRAEAAEQPRRERLARLQTACMQFSLGTLDEAESACAEALDLKPGDDQLSSSLARVRNLIGANRNVPLLFKVGVEAVTY